MTNNEEILPTVGAAMALRTDAMDKTPRCEYELSFIQNSSGSVA